MSTLLLPSVQDTSVNLGSSDDMGESQAVPFYRLWQKNQGDHFYTATAFEVIKAMQDSSFQFESITGRLLPNRLYGALPLYRAYGPTATDHFYTMDWAKLQDFVVKQ
ncbi:hypothetical protein FRC19_002967, partial [Serendipita sp. 401]